MDLMTFFWLFLILSSLTPMMTQRWVAMRRLGIISAMGKARKSRVISLIHRQEALSVLGMAFVRYIDIEDSEAVLRAIRLTPDDTPIDLIVHTPGGLVLAAEQIAWALAKHPATVTVHVPHYAMSGGTLLALAADEIVMDDNAVLGPVDPQIGVHPAASILRAVERKDIDKVDDETLILADVAEKALAQVRRSVTELLAASGLERSNAEDVADLLSSGTWTHDYPIRVETLQELGISVSTDLPPEIHTLMALYPQPRGRRPSVQYVDIAGRVNARGRRTGP